MIILRLSRTLDLFCPIITSFTALFILHMRNLTACPFNFLDIASRGNLCQRCNLSQRHIFAITKYNVCTNILLRISLIAQSLCSNNYLTRFRNNGLFFRLVNLASQSRNQQGGQDSQNDQNNDQLDEGEALFVFQFFEHLVFLQYFVFVPTLQDLIGISYRNFITQFVFCQAKTCCKNPFCVFLLFSSLEFIGNRALFMNFNERLRYLIDCEEIKLKDLAPKLCLSASTLSNYAQGIREPDYDTLRRIADYFGVSIDYLLGHETPAVDDERQLLTCYRSFTPSQKRFLLDQAALIKRYKIRLDD